MITIRSVLLNLFFVATQMLSGNREQNLTAKLTELITNISELNARQLNIDLTGRPHMPDRLDILPIPPNHTVHKNVRDYDSIKKLVKPLSITKNYFILLIYSRDPFLGGNLEVEKH